MAKIKMISNPYERSLTYYIYKKQSDTWENIEQDSINSRLRENNGEKIFLPFQVKEIVDTIVSEYYVGTGQVELIFEGTEDEYEEIENVCSDEAHKDKVHLLRSTRVLENARDILDHAKEIFDTVQPIIKNIVKDDAAITDGLEKVSDALKDIIPICIFGNYSAGKSTFINALIGYEILPSGGDPITSKIYEIKRSGQEDRAKISFAYRSHEECEEYELQFDHKSCRVFAGDKEKDLIQEIQAAIERMEAPDLFHMVNKTIDIINSFEKKDRSTTLIGNVIRVEVPFSENGRLGQSHNEFVIFDTPGSNSKTNMDHKEVLKKALEKFSNGIPIWVSGYDSIDSVDNSTLCDMLYEIDALDKRFTMIVVNKADSVELPKNGLDREAISDLMEYESVEKMYSSGIYFVSSVMGLGAKNPEGIVSDYILDVFEEKERKFSDPAARSYKKLYEYNIMPEQMKRRAIEYSAACENLIYANSGLYCVEMEMEQFASRYAAYNKCQMVYMFLQGVIDKAEQKIAEKTASYQKRKQKWEQDLDAKKFELVENIRKSTTDSIKKYEKESKTFMQTYVKDSKELQAYEYTAEEIEKKDRSFAEENEQKAGFAVFEKDYEGAKDSRWRNFIENSQNLLKGNFTDRVRDLATEWVSDSKAMQGKKESMDMTRQNVDKETSDRLLKFVVKEFRKNMVDAQERLGEAARQHWQENERVYREEMIRLINGSDALPEKQRAELSNVILSYQDFRYDDGADKVFIKAKFLRGNVLGIRLVASERLNTARLAASYNTKIRHNIGEMAQLINKGCFSSFEAWQKNLQALIEENITIYNPELRELTESIREESERILELQTNRQTISNSFQTMEHMMSWKELE